MTIKMKLQNIKNKLWMLEEKDPILKKIWMTYSLEEDQDLLEDNQKNKRLNLFNKQRFLVNLFNK
jgi:hypothetical protein